MRVFRPTAVDVGSPGHTGVGSAALGQTPIRLFQRDARHLLVLGYVVLLGALVRLSFVAGSDFPLHDGGLFYVMVRDLQRAHYVLPAYTSYNAAGIPFAYPPLAFYLAGLLDDLTPWSLLDVFRIFPLICSLLTIVAMSFLASSMLPSRAAAVVALFAFALIPRSFNWQIMGGGLTRSLGFLFAILAIHRAYLLYTSRARKHAPLAIAFSVGTVLSHIEMGWFAAFSIAVLFVAYGRSRAGLLHSLVVAIGTLVLTAPWWGSVLAHHGISPFLAATEHGVPLHAGMLRLLLLEITDEPQFPLIVALALLGVLACLTERRYLLPIWLVVLFVLDPRKALTYATVPLALLAGIGVTEVLLPLLNRTPFHTKSTNQSAERTAERVGTGLFQGRLTTVVLAFMLVYAMFSAMVADRSLLAALAHDEREAMTWIAANTPSASTFLVITSDPWALDASSEWFPVLAERVSVATVQGYEWMPNHAFVRRIEQSDAVQECATRGATCLEDWAKETGASFTHVYVAKESMKRLNTALFDDCCWSLRESLGSDNRYELAYDGPGATVYRRVSSR